MTRQGKHPSRITNLFCLCGVFVVLPFVDIPFIGLSVTAPIMLPIMFYALFQTKERWVHPYRGWLLIVVAIWAGMIVSFLANGPWLKNREMQMGELANLIRYAYWLFVFIVSAWMASDFQVQRRLPVILGAGVIILAGMRCFEALAFGKVGAWVNTIFTTQNNYGVLFSTFTPFLFPALLSRRCLRVSCAAAGLILVLLACSLNGSRGSWICIAAGLIVFISLAFISHPGTSVRLALPLGLCVLALSALVASLPSARQAVLDRFSTFDDLEKDKSYMTRQVMNQKSCKLLQEFPFFGVGPGRYQSVYVPLDLPPILAHKMVDDFTRKGSHNSYLSFLAEGGVVGTLPLGVLISILAVRGAWAAMALSRKGEHWALGVFASFTAMSLHLWSLAGLTGTHAWFVYGLLAATIHLASTPRKQQPVSPARAQLPHRRLPFRRACPVIVINQ